MNEYKYIHDTILAQINQLIDNSMAESTSSFENRLRTLREKLDSEHFHIVVMGQFKRGKTTFINSLLETEVLPSSVVPLTSINTILRYGDQLKAVVHYLDGNSREIEVGELPLYVTEKENPENRLGVSRVEVFFPSPYLKDGVCLVDTPGTGSTYLHNDEMAYSYLLHADAVIFMISADPPVSRLELDFLHRIRGHVRKVFFVQNKIDYLEDHEREESINFNREVISEALGLDSVEIYPLSAKMALKGAKESDKAMLERSGLSNFVSRLEDFLMREKGRILLESNIKNLLKALDDEFSALELEKSLLNHPLEELEEKIQAFHEQMELIKREKEEIRFLIDGEYKRLIRDTLDVHVEEFKAQMTEPLLQRYEAFFDENAHLPGHALADALGKFIQDEIRELFTDWRYAEEKRLSEEFKKMARRYMDRANSIANRILEIAGQLFGLTLPHLEAELDLSEEGEFWFKMGEPPSDLEMFIGAITKSLPKKLSHRLLKKSKKGDLLMLFDRHCGRVRYDFYLRLQKSVGVLSYSVDDVIRETLGAIEEGIDKAVSQLKGGRESLSAVMERILARQSQIDAARQELSGLMEEIMESSDVH